MLASLRAGCAAIAVGLVVSGCASRSASVDQRMILPGGARLQPAQNELFVMPVALFAPPPEFPETVQRMELEPTPVCIEVWISEEGAVTHVAPLYGLDGCAMGPEAGTQELEHAVVTRLREWNFAPARLCRIPEDQREKLERGDCTGEGVVITQLPIRLAYVFTFEVKNGKRRVGTARAK